MAPASSCLPCGFLRGRGLLAVLLAAAGAAAVIAAAVEGQCDADKGGANCLPSQLGPSPPTSSPTPKLETAAGGDEAPLQANGTGAKTMPKEELGAFRLGFVLCLLAFVLLWIGGTIKFALDGSLPARLALWGLLPEAYAAISVSSVVALLRLKTGTTPVVVLRNCVSDQGTKELAEAMLRYGKRADLQALELPHNPAMGKVGMQHLASAAQQKDGAPLQELDVSYNPQLGDESVEVLLPLLRPKASQINTLRLADCSLSVSFLQRFAEAASKSTLRVLDLSCNALEGGGEALATLCEAPVLEELTLACCGLLPADVSAVADQLPYTSLRSLHLGGNRFGGAGLAALCEHLPHSQVDELGLEGNDLELGDLSPLGQAWAARPFSRIRLNSNRMSNAEVAGFIRTLKSIHS